MSHHEQTIRGEIKRLEETRFANQRVPASCIIDQLPGAQVAPATNGSPGVVDLDNVEPALGNPASNGYVLSSTTAGARSWVAQSGDVAAAIHAATDKATPVDADETALADSAASYGLKKVTWANLKATLKSYFDGMYAALTHKSRHATGGADALSPADIGAATTSAASLTSGTLADARLSSNVPLKDAANTFSAEQTATGLRVGASLGGMISAYGASDCAAFGRRHSTSYAGPTFLFYRSRNSSGADAVTASGDYLARFVGYGYNGSAYREAGDMRLEASQAGNAGSGNLTSSWVIGSELVQITNRLKADTIETAAGSQWKLAGYTADATDRASNGYVTVTIGGVSYKLLTRA